MPITITPVSVSGASVSGGAAPTPISGTVSGPFYVLTQELLITYARTPANLNVSLAGPSSLSATYTPIYYVNGTDLNYVVYASVKVVKDFAAYGTSSFQQLQKFTVLPDTDPWGNSYGTTSGAGVLGPAGTIITSQPYIFRRPWVEATDSESTSIMTGTNRIFYNIGTGDGSLISLESPTEQGNLSNFKQGIDPKQPMNLLGAVSTRRRSFSAGPAYQLANTYAATQETFAGFQAFLDQIGDTIKNQSFYKTSLVAGTDVTGTFWNGLTVQSSALVGIPSYDSNRHDYT